MPKGVQLLLIKLKLVWQTAAAKQGSKPPTRTACAAIAVVVVAPAWGART